MVPASAALILVTARLLHLGGQATGAFVGRGLLFVGAFSLLQLAVGHRVPAFEGPSSVTLAALIFALHRAGSIHPVAATVGALLVSGAVLAGLGVTGALRALQRAYTPFVNGVFLLLLSGSIVWELLPATLHASRGPSGAAPVALAVVVLATLALERWGGRPWRAVSILAGFAGGLMVFLIAGSLGQPIAPAALSHLGAGLRPLRPAFPPGIVVPVAAMAVLVALNALASIKAVGAARGEGVDESSFRRALVVTGLSHATQGLFLGTASVPHAESASLAGRHPRSDRPSLAVGSLLTCGVGLAQPAVAFLLRLPVALADDVFVAIMLTLALAGVRELVRARRNVGRWITLAVATGGWALLMPGRVAWLPAALAYMTLSPMLVGVSVALAGEALTRAARDGRARTRAPSSSS